MALTTFLINSHHLFYGLSFPLHQVNGWHRKSYSIFALCDEAYALTASKDPRDAHQRPHRRVSGFIRSGGGIEWNFAYLCSPDEQPAQWESSLGPVTITPDRGHRLVVREVTQRLRQSLHMPTCRSAVAAGGGSVVVGASSTPLCSRWGDIYRLPHAGRT